jgi:hypothetical protein
LPAADGTNGFSFDVRGPYFLTIVCDDHTRSRVHRFARTPDDDRVIDMNDVRCAPPVARSTVHGHLVQAGSVTLGDGAATEIPADSDFDVVTARGTHDLVAISPDPMAVRRSVVVEADRTLTPIDIDAEGQRLLPTAPTITNVISDENLSGLIYLATAETSFLTAVSFGAPASLLAAPSSVLSPGLFQTIEIDADDADNSRSSGRDNFRIGDPMIFALPDRLGSVRFAVKDGELSAATDVERGDEFQLVLFPRSAHTVGNVVIASHSFFEATRATSIETDSTIPGFQPSWRVDLSEPYQALYTVLTRDGDAWTASSRKQDFNVPAARAPSIAPIATRRMLLEERRYWTRRSEQSR